MTFQVFSPPTWHKWWPELPFRTSCKNGRMCAPWLNQATSLKYLRLKSLEKTLIWQHFLFCLLWDIWLQIWEDYRISAKGFGDNVAEILVCPQSGKKGNFQCSKTLIDLESTFHITIVQLIGNQHRFAHSPAQKNNFSAKGWNMKLYVGKCHCHWCNTTMLHWFKIP